MLVIIFVLVRAIGFANKACGAYMDAKYPAGTRMSGMRKRLGWCPHNQSKNENHGDR